MRNLRILILLLFAYGMPVLVNAQDHCYETQRKMGIQLFNLGDYATAYENFESALMCTDTPENNDLQAWMDKCMVTLKLNLIKLEFGAAGGEEKCVEVITSAKSIRTEYPDWCLVNTKGKNVYVRCKDNFTDKKREAKIKVIAGGKSVFIEVVQHGGELELRWEPDSVLFSSGGETRVVKLFTNASQWSIDSSPEWLMAKRQNDSMVLTSSTNMSAEGRKAQVLFSVSDKIYAVPVAQSGADTTIILDRQELTFPAEGKEMAIAVTTNVKGWEVESSDEKWMVVRRDHDSVRISVAPNDLLFSRHGDVRVKSGKHICEVKVHQFAHVSSLGSVPSDLDNYYESSDRTILVTSFPSDLVVYVDGSLAKTTPFELNVDFKHHSLLMGFEQREILLNGKQRDIVYTPGFRFANITFASPKTMGLMSGFVSDNAFGAYAHFKISRPFVNQFTVDGDGLQGYHLSMGPVYQPVPYAGVFAGIGIGIHEGLPHFGFDYEFGVMGFYKNMMLTMGYQHTRMGQNVKQGSFMVGLGGYLKRYYDSDLGYCASDSRRWWSLNYVFRPASNGKGVMFGDLGQGKTRAYIKGLYVHPNDSTKRVNANVGVVFTPVNGIIDVCAGVGVDFDFWGHNAYNAIGFKDVFKGVDGEVGVILNLWRFPITFMLHDSDLLGERKLYVDFGVGFHIGEFKRSSYK